MPPKPVRVPDPPAAPRSFVWKRTVYYFLTIVAIFLVAAAFLLFSVGRERSSQDLLLAVSAADLKLQTAELTELRLEAAELDRAELLALLDDRIAERRQGLALIDRVRTLERAPRDAGNEDEITERLAADYAALRTDWRYPEWFGLVEEQYLRFALVLFFFFLSVSLVLFVLIRMILNPLETLIQGVRRVAAGQLDVRFQPGTRDELDELALVLDGLVGNIRGMLGLMRGVSHNGVVQSIQLEQLLRDEATGVDRPGDSERDSSHDPARMQDLSRRASELKQIFQEIQGTAARYAAGNTAR